MPQSNLRLRWLIVWVVAAIWVALVFGRLSYLQLFRYSEYFARAQRQQQRIFEISPNRGTIYDRNGRELAVSLPMDSVFADPASIADPAMVAQLLSRVLKIPADDLETKIREAHTPVRLAMKLSPGTVRRIDNMNLKGVFFQKENRRVYPQHDLAASVIGYVNIDEKGLGGIEYSLDKEIRGRPGKMMVLADGRRRWYDRREAAAETGSSVVLTIDETIQYIAEKELARAIQETHAIHGSIVVQDPNNGQLLAIADWPTFDPNNAGSYPADSRMDRAISAAYEPGSIFKTITMTSAIETGVARPNELVNCQMGSILVAGRLIHDWHRFGMLSVTQILENSSDVGTIKLALRVGAPRFYDVMRQFGIGQATGILLPGENRGLLRPLNEWTPSSIGSLAMGQEVSVTPIQIVSAVSALANGGILYKPRVVKEVRGGIQPFTLPGNDPARVTSPKTAATLRAMMADVVLYGTGKKAQLDGYTAAGKTGTAQKIDPATGRYSRRFYNASFVGFAPVNNPAVTILVHLDSPTVGSHEGGMAAAPVWKRVAQQVLAYLDVPHDVPAPSDTEMAANTDRSQQAAEREVAKTQAMEARFEAAVAKRARHAAPTVAFGSPDSVLVPDLSGQTVRAVVESCSHLGLIPTLIGNGLALEQFPAGGTPVVRGSQVTVRFGRPGSSTLSHGRAN